MHHTSVKVLLFIVNSLFILSGAVNLGASRFFLAIPMIYFQYAYIGHFSRKFKIAGICIYVLGTIFFALQFIPNKIYYPDLKEKFTLIEDMCLLERSRDGVKFWKGEEFKFRCVQYDSNYRAKILKSGSVITLETVIPPSGLLSGTRYIGQFSGEDLIIDVDFPNTLSVKGKPYIRSEDYVRDEINWLSKLMYYPMAILSILEFFN